MISVVCWLWRGPLRTFLPAHVNTLARMVAHHLPQPHRFICVADHAEGFEPHVEVIPTPQEARDIGALQSPEGPRFPSCYRRLWGFSREAGAAFGERFLVVDIDLVVMGSLLPLLDRPEEFVGWRPYRDWGKHLRFGGGIYLLKAGARVNVWEDFKGLASVQEARKAGYRGSDQAWISYKLARPEKEVYWDRGSGLYSIRDFKPGATPPHDARIVQFNGNDKPWQTNLQWARNKWAQFEPPRPSPYAVTARPRPTSLGKVLGQRISMPLK